MSEAAYFALEPEVAGELGNGTVIDHSVDPPAVLALEYQLSWGWQGDELLEAYPCFVVSERLAQALTSAEASGFELDDVVFSEDEQLAEIGASYGDLPSFRWLKVVGLARQDDVGIGADKRLVVSRRALDALMPGIGNHCEITPLS
jgi:hypothetical protein